MFAKILVLHLEHVRQFFRTNSLTYLLRDAFADIYIFTIVFYIRVSEWTPITVCTVGENFECNPPEHVFFR